MPVGCLGNTSNSDQKDLKNNSCSGSHLDEGGGNGSKQQVSVKTSRHYFSHIITI